MAMKRNELVVLLVILAIATGFRLWHLNSLPANLSPSEGATGVAALRAWHGHHLMGVFATPIALAVGIFGNHIWVLRLVPALMGIFAVLGVYALARLLFEWELAAIAAFLMATSAWQVQLSRVAIIDVMVPLCAVWGCYELFSGLRTNHLWHWFLAGLWFGTGWYTSPAFHFMPFLIIVVLLGYLWSLKDFQHDRYHHTRHQVWGGFALMLGVMLLIMMPGMVSWYTNPNLYPLVTQNVAHHILDTLGALVFGPTLFWVVGLLFAVGFIRNCIKIGKSLHTHGHASVPHLVLVSWLALGVLTDPLLAAPAIFIIASEGLWWLFVWLKHWYGQRDAHRGENTLAATVALIALLLAIAIADANAYFVDWASSPAAHAMADERTALVADRANALPPAVFKYIITSDARAAAAVLFLTDTATPQGQITKNMTSLTPAQYQAHHYHAGGVVFHLE